MSLVSEPITVVWLHQNAVYTTTMNLSLSHLLTVLKYLLLLLWAAWKHQCGRGCIMFAAEAARATGAVASWLMRPYSWLSETELQSPSPFWGQYDILTLLPNTLCVWLSILCNSFTLVLIKPHSMVLAVDIIASIIAEYCIAKLHVSPHPWQDRVKLLEVRSPGGEVIDWCAVSPEASWIAYIVKQKLRILQFYPPKVCTVYVCVLYFFLFWEMWARFNGGF